MTTIKLSPFGRPTGVGDTVESQHDWGENVFVQGGFKGLVLDGKGNSYRTAFVEAFPDGTFIRGEGADIVEAENAAWVKYARQVACPGHEWEARGYTNGAGFCKHCGRFESNVFTGEQLGQYCATCAKGTTYAKSRRIARFDSYDGECNWYCEKHSEEHDRKFYIFLSSVPGDELSKQEISLLSSLRFQFEDDEPLTDEEITQGIAAVLTGLAEPNSEK